MHPQTKRIAPLVTAFTILTAVAFAHNPGGKPDPMNASLEKLNGAEFEQSFLQQMIQHHRSGIDMAKLASDHTQRAELRQFAEKMISNQQQQIETMTGWLRSWYNASPKGVANEAADKEMKTHISMLADKKDSDFDKAFLEMMPKHHHAAVEMCEQAEKKATHPELKEFAAKLAKDQQQESKQMKDWAQAWFGPA
jgi:uncharacterized protein (DUF305 family)